jgi:hypothetical protein
MSLTLLPDTFSAASCVCSSGWRDVEMLGTKRLWRGDAVFYHYGMMFGLVHAVFWCKDLRPIHVQVGDGSNTNRNTPVTVVGSGVVSVALGMVR